MGNNMNFKPLLAAAVDLDKLRFPVLVSPKLDGIRAMTLPGQGIVSRKLKPIPNEYIRSHDLPVHLDGEIMTYTDGKPDDFNTIQSKVMSRDGEPDWKLVVFDTFENPLAPFSSRVTLARQVVDICVDHLVQHYAHSLAELSYFEENFLEQGYEGLMIRDPSGRYKFGRSTANEQILLKMKRFHDAEAIVVGKVEKFHNTNALERDALGHAKRSSAKAGKVPAGTLGALVCQFGDIQFEIGTGFDDALRQQIWSQDVEGQLVTFKYQELSKDGVPRFPVFLGFRHDL